VPNVRGSTLEKHTPHIALAGLALPLIAAAMAALHAPAAAWWAVLIVGLFLLGVAAWLAIHARNEPLPAPAPLPLRSPGYEVSAIAQSPAAQEAARQLIEDDSRERPILEAEADRRTEYRKRVGELITEAERLRETLPEALDDMLSSTRDENLVAAKLSHEAPVLDWRQRLLDFMNEGGAEYGLVSLTEPSKPAAIHFGQYLDDRIGELKEMYNHLW
jgi:hypothetical protein